MSRDTDRECCPDAGTRHCECWDYTDHILTSEPNRETDRPLYHQYRRTATAEMADWHPGFDMAGVSISDADRKAGSPKLGDKIARNPANHDDRWLVAAQYVVANFEAL
jgi:hypothetical protein